MNIANKFQKTGGTEDLRFLEQVALKWGGPSIDSLFKFWDNLIELLCQHKVSLTIINT